MNISEPGRGYERDLPKAMDESLSLASILEMFLWELPRTDWVDPCGRGSGGLRLVP